MPEVFRRVPGTVVLGTLIVVLILALSATASVRAENPIPIGGTPEFTLQEAIEQALLNNPELEIFSAEILAREGETLQAGLRPNPVLSVEAENVLGSGPFSGTGAAETTISLSQTVELGEKRTHRRALAEAQTSVAHSDFLLARADLLARATDGFIAVLAAQERLALAEERSVLAKLVLDTVGERISAGRAAQTEVIRPRILFREQEIARDRARRELAAARAVLGALMGLESADFGPAAGDFSRIPPLPSLAELERLLSESPTIVRRGAEVDLRRRAVRLEEARRIPDLELGVGARYLRETEDTALVLGVSIPLPVFDRNEGDIAAARSRQAQARALERSALLQSKIALAEAWQQMSAARMEAQALREDIIPAARQALESADYGYRVGKFGLLDLLDAQHTLMEAQERRLGVLTDFHRAAAELERLLGSPMSIAPHASRLSDIAKE